MHCGKGHRFSPNQSSLSHNFSYKDAWARYGAKGDFIPLIQPIWFESIRLVPGKEVLGCPKKKPLTWEWIYGITLKHTVLVILFIFNIFRFFAIIIILLVLLFYVSFLALLLSFISCHYFILIFIFIIAFMIILVLIHIIIISLIIIMLNYMKIIIMLN